MEHVNIPAREIRDVTRDDRKLVLHSRGVEQCIDCRKHTYDARAVASSRRA